MSAETANGPRARRLSPQVIALVIFAQLLVATKGAGLLGSPYLLTWEAVFVALVVQALPFLLLGVIASGLVAAFVSEQRLASLLPDRPAAAVAVACVAGAALPGCECGSVPLARRLIDRGAPTGAALTFMLAAPGINPVVLVATAVAFPGRPVMVLGRLLASALAAIVVGLVWLKLGRVATIRERIGHAAHRHGDAAGGGIERFARGIVEDLVQAGGFLVIGASLAATAQVVFPDVVLGRGSGTLAAVLAMAVAAVVLSICSEADAFVASSLAPAHPVAQLTFMTVGPAIDLKLAAMQTGYFGARFAPVFGTLAFVVTTLSAALVGALLL